MPTITLDDLRARFELAADPVQRNSLRQRGRAAALKSGMAMPDWCARQRSLRAPATTPLTASLEAQTGPVTLPVYDSLRAWARAGGGARVLCWHAEGRVSIVWIVTDFDRRRSQTFASEAAALDDIAAGRVRWASPRKATGRVRPFQF
jgi:hypothetical protein